MSKLASLRELEASLTSQLEGVRMEIKSLESVEASPPNPSSSPAQPAEEEVKSGTDCTDDKDTKDDAGTENGEEDWEGEYIEFYRYLTPQNTTR